jgi:hypothetical protein
LNKFFIASEAVWHKINESHGEDGGVYVLKCLNVQESNPVPVSRLLARDDEGVLYIGQANSFICRVAELKNSISPSYTSESHECGFRYKQNHEISVIFPYKNLFLEFVASSEPRVTESELLQKYALKFGELPPLNRSR